MFKIVHCKVPVVRKLQVRLWLSHGLRTVTPEPRVEAALSLYESLPPQYGQETPGNIVSSLLNKK